MQVTAAQQQPWRGNGGPCQRQCLLMYSLRLQFSVRIFTEMSVRPTEVKPQSLGHSLSWLATGSTHRPSLWGYAMRCGFALLLPSVYNGIQGGQCKNWIRKMQNGCKNCFLAYILRCRVIATLQGNLIYGVPPPAQFSGFVDITE